MKEFGFEIPSLIKTQEEIRIIAESIPTNWQNNSTHKTDVAYLFPQIDSQDIINQLPIKNEFIDIRYITGAIYWNVERTNYNKSQINKIISTNLYQFMTLRNINTARYL